ncbi:hypothetical protein KKC44_01360 [Patescibacteria group bacterium]|nr:hypothetical protein [Patescibacteria group bacterium]MBU2259230.1 hypothetical protein [Patescibacteria group bacterium]
MCGASDIESASSAFENALSVAEAIEGDLSYGVKMGVYETREQLHAALEAKYGDDWLDVTDFDDLFARAKVVLGELPKPDQPKVKKRRSFASFKIGENGGLLSHKARRPYR